MKTLAVAQVRQTGCSVLAASRQHKMPYGTLHRNCMRAQSSDAVKRPGGQPILSEQEERLVLSMADVLTEWKFPLTAGDICSIVRSFLDRCPRVTKFKDNLPSTDWVKLFMKRHNLTARVSENVKPACVKITQDVIKGGLGWKVKF